MHKFNKENPKPGLYLDLPNSIYHESDGISNSGLRLIQNNPADYMWSKHAPQDPSKTTAIDLGSAIHLALLEPEKMESILIGPTKGRDTIKFADFCQEHPDNIVLTESEYTQLKFCVDSVHAHPTANQILQLKSNNESSIFWHDEKRDILCKIRPDIDLTPSGTKVLVDVKTTKSIDEWRSDLTWKNPLFTLGYGHNAAFYLNGASTHYGESYDEYVFLLIQTTACIGRYPVAVFSLTRQEIENYGFFDEVNANLNQYAACLKSNNWAHSEYFPFFEGQVIASE